jgi:putative endonuclease
MPVYVYVLYSEDINQYYVGLTKNRSRRLKQHIRGQSKWTSRADDWSEVYSFCAVDLKEAREYEKRIKTRGIRRFLDEVAS